MGLINDVKDSFKRNIKMLILVIIASVIIGISWSLIKGKKKEWAPPRDINREYQGEIIQKLLQGRTAPDVQNNREQIAPERREQQDRGVTPPPADRREFAPRQSNGNYSDF